GARAPRLVTERMVKEMEAGSVIVDVSIDQGGCVATARPTTHDNPTYLVHDVIHYMVANMPGAVPKTSTYALTNATIPYVHKLANNGLEGAIAKANVFESGLNTYKGTVRHAAVAEALGVTHTPYKQRCERSSSCSPRAVAAAATTAPASAIASARCRIRRWPRRIAPRPAAATTPSSSRAARAPIRSMR